MTLQLSIPEPTPSQNVILRKFKNIHARKREQLRWDWLVIEALSKHPGYPRPVNRCDIRVVRYGEKLLDWDNMMAGVKFLLDGLTHAGIIADDSPLVIRELTQDQYLEARGDTRTVVEITPLGAG